MDLICILIIGQDLNLLMRSENYINIKQVFQTCVLREADGERAACDLLLKQILLIEKEDDGGLCEPFIVADGVKELHALMHTVLGTKKKKLNKK